MGVCRECTEDRAIYDGDMCHVCTDEMMKDFDLNYLKYLDNNTDKINDEEVEF